MAQVIFSNVSKRFPGPTPGRSGLAVDRISLTIAEGSLVTLLGPSGCGKTTTLRMLAGFETPSDGTIAIGGKEVTHVPANARNVGMVFQSYALFPHLSVRQNIEYGVRLQKLSQDESARRVGAILETMGLDVLADRMPAQLSGGQQQRVALARAVVTQPKVLLFDEPLSNLDAQLRERMRDELRAIQRRLGITSLYVTHDQSEAMAISDRIVIMRDGLIEQDDTPRNVYARPNSAFVAEFMGRANIVSGKVRRISADEAEIAMLGGKVIVRPQDPVTVGMDVRCVVRPEHVVIDPQGPFRTTVRRTTFLGPHVQYEGEIDGSPITITDGRYGLNGVADEGSAVAFALEGRSVWLLPEAAGDRARAP